MRWLILLLLCLTQPVSAQTVQVSTGEHDGFTRIVLTRPAPAAWRLSRTETGYELRILGATGYDLARAFDRINRRRLGALIHDPGEGTLRFGVACACHAVPFEYGPAMLVVDLRDGPPPPDSAFERDRNGNVLPALTGGAVSPPVAQVSRYDWLSVGTGRTRPDGTTLPARPEPEVPVDLASLREALMMQFSRAASQGLIEPARPVRPPQDDPVRPPASTVNIRVGEPLDAFTALDPGKDLAPDGSSCPSPDRLAIGDWGDGRAGFLQLSAASVLVGEFDEADPAALARAVRLYLHLGFGVEAVALLSAFPTDHPDATLWRSMARGLDGEPEPGSAFAAMAACDGPAALWSVIAAPETLPAPLNTNAVQRSFSQLPPHLRRHLGPDLAERFLDAGDKSTATAILDAILRLPGEPDPRTAVTVARIAMARGDTADAGRSLRRILSDPGMTQVPALVALVDMHAADLTPIDPQTVPVLAAHLQEATGTSGEQVLGRALVLARALSGDFDAAFADLATHPDIAPKLWEIVAAGPDQALIAHAVGGDPLPAARETRQSIALRLSELGFVAAAARWAPPGDDVATTGTATPLETALDARDWGALPDDAPIHWRMAADRLAPVPADPLPPLAHGRRVAEESTRTQEIIRALLDSVPPP